MPRHALVTGGANGIGAATVAQLCRDGLRVTFCDRDAQAGASVRSETFDADGAQLEFDVSRAALEELARTFANITRGRGDWDVQA
ncbi:SDR family NAD(P)-dependent oxidoreductase [Bordetella pertussis]